MKNTLIGKILIQSLIPASIAFAQAGADPVADPVPLLEDFSCSWVANSYPGRGDLLNGDWMQHWAHGMAAGADGRIYLTTHWEESGRRGGIYKEGKALGQAIYVGEGEIEPGGEEVGVNSTHVFYSRGQGLLRYNLDGRAPLMLVDDVGGEIMGIAATDEAVYVTLHEGFVVIFSLDGTEVRRFAVKSPGAIGVAPEGDIYVISGVSRTGSDASTKVEHILHWIVAEGATPAVVRFDSSGTESGRFEFTDKGMIPSALAVDRSDPGRLWVADYGPDQRIHKFRIPDFKPDGHLGTPGGYLAGPVPGRTGPGRLMRPWGVATDSAGNIHVLNFKPHTWGGRPVLQSYTADGKLLHELNGLAFIDTLQPVGDGTTMYSAADRFSYDFSKPVTSTSSPWKHEAVTIDPFKYPDEGRELGPYIIDVAGTRLMYTIGQYSGGIFIHRFDGEIAVPAGHIERQGQSPKIWTDQNGDGLRDEGESATGGIDAGENFAMYVDSRGNIWDCYYDGALPEGQSKWVIRRLDFQGLNEYGVPQYSWDKVSTFGNPPGMTEVGRLEYFPESDTMYLMGYTDEFPRVNDVGTHDPSPWGSAGRVVYRYDHFTKEDEQTLHPGYPFDVPFFVRTSLGGGSGMAGPVAPDQRTVHFEGSVTPADFIVLGNPAATRAGEGHLFVIWSTTGPTHLNRKSWNEIRVYDVATRQCLGYMAPKDPLQAEGMGWLDTRRAMKGIRTPEGEYVITTEEGGRGKFVIYRWKPAGAHVEPAPL
jgi:hypothetical protein